MSRRFRYDPEADAVVEVTGQVAVRSDRMSPVIGAYSEANPLVSEGLGCLPSQVPEMREAIRQEGIAGARVRDNGAIEFTSRSARRAVLKLRHKRDNDGGYGDG